MERQRQNQRQMQNQRQTQRRGRRVPYHFDYNLLFLLLFVIGFGLIMLYSATAFKSSIGASDPAYYLKKQAFFTVLGLFVMLFLIFFKTEWIQKVSLLIYLGAMGTVLLLLTSLASSSHGASRWIALGPVSFQPAELVKIAIIVLMADLISRMGRKIVTRKGILLLLGIIGATCLLVFVISSNLSSALIIGGIGVVMLFVAHPKYKGFIIATVLGMILVTVFVIWFSPMLMKVDFRFDRIEAWKNPELYEDGTGYQTLLALYAIGSGGIFGKGLGKSAQKLIIPEVQNDMIFSIVCEELGIFGAVMVLLLFLMMIYRMVIIAKNAPDRFSGLLVVGITAHIALQVLINTAVVTKLIPNTGVTLPFFSYGGSATLCLLAEMGIVLGVSRRSKE